MMPGMDGLKRAMPASEDEGMGMMMGQGGGGPEQAIGLLEEAVQLHAGHLSGQVPVTPESQEELMELIGEALGFLKGGM